MIEGGRWWGWGVEIVWVVGEYPPGVVWIAGAWVMGDGVVAEIDFVGVFWGVGAFLGRGWCGYTGKSFLPLYAH